MNHSDSFKYSACTDCDQCFHVMETIQSFKNEMAQTRRKTWQNNGFTSYQTTFLYYLFIRITGILSALKCQKIVKMLKFQENYLRHRTGDSELSSQSDQEEETTEQQTSCSGSQAVHNQIHQTQLVIQPKYIYYQQYTTR